MQYTRFNETKGLINCLSFNHNGELLASGGDDETVGIWEVPARKCQQIIEDHGKRWGQIICLAWIGGRSSENLQPIVFGTGCGLVVIYRRSRMDVSYNHHRTKSEIYSTIGL
jgi:WD40 repeat protein